MPFYEYRIKSGECGVCNGCFVDLQKMSDPAHVECPDCGKPCERVIAAPIVSVRGAEYRASANAERRTENLGLARKANDKLREATLKKYEQLEGHTHNCALAGCYGADVQSKVSESQGTSLDVRSGPQARRFGGLPHLVGADKKKP